MRTANRPVTVRAYEEIGLNTGSGRTAGHRAGDRRGPDGSRREPAGSRTAQGQAGKAAGPRDNFAGQTLDFS